MKDFLARLKRRIKKVSRKQWKHVLLLATAAGIFCAGTMVIWIATFKIPTLDTFSERQVVESTKIYDRTGEVLLYDVNQNTKRTVVPFEEISRNVKNATIAIEDEQFYLHNGVRPTSFVRAIIANIFSLSYSQGGSTITQQVVKNALLTNDKSLFGGPARKIKEWILAIRLEKILTKDEILNLYLNEIPYGGPIYGIEEASQTFFGTSAADLTLAQSAYLAALPQAPSFYSPYGKNLDRLKQRKDLVLSQMLKNGFIDESEYQEAKKEEVEFKPREEKGIKAPHFVFYVIGQLEERYGEETVRNGGLKVTTSLDYRFQEKGEEIAKRFALENKEKFNAENAAFTAIDPKTGEVLVMVGSRDYFDPEIDGNFNIATTHRQPGSTFKPFVYAAAFNKGYTPETVLFDVKTQFSTSCPVENTTSLNGCYSPENYDNAFHGPMTMRESLAQSINVTSVKTLYLAGLRNALELAEKMGIQSLGDPNQYGLTLVLGGGEVSLLDMTSAYGVFAAEGIRYPAVSILKVEDRERKVLEEYEASGREVLPRETALKISSILSDNVARAPAFGESSLLHFSSRDVAVKTGTTNDYKDAWILGYTPNIVLGAWAGNNDNSSMERRVAGFIVAPMWRAFMDELLAATPSESFPEPMPETVFDLKPVLRGKWLGGISHLVDRISGKNATAFTPEETTEEMLSGGIHSILYWVERNDPRGPVPTNPFDDPQFKYWEYGVARWLQGAGIAQPEDPRLPQGFDDIHHPDSAPTVTITSPEEGEEYLSSDQITVRIEPEERSSLAEARFFLNDVYLGKAVREPFSFTFTPNEFSFLEGSNTLTVVAYDSIYNGSETRTTFFLSEDR